MSYTKIDSIIGGRGADSLPDSEYIYFLERNNPTNPSGIINEWRITPYALVSGGITELPGDGLSGGLDLDGDDVPDILWDGVEIYPGLMSGLARLPRYDTDAESLAELVYGDSGFPETGGSTTGNSYAVSTSSGNFAKLRVFKDSADGRTKLEWATYRSDKHIVPVGFGYQDPRDMVLAVENGVTVAYVSALRKVSGRDVGTVYRVPRDETAGSRLFKPVSTSYIVADWSKEPTRNNPRQLALHKDYLYIINSDALLRVRVNTTVKSVPEVVYTGLTGATGLLLSADGTRAYITDMAVGGASGKAGRLLSININSDGKGALHKVLRTELGPTGLLEWADAEHTAIYLSQLDTSEVIRLRDLEAPTLAADPVLTATPKRSHSVMVMTTRGLFIVSDEEIGTLDMALPVDPGILVMGIGHVPFQFIEQDEASPNAGRANTSGTSYFFQVNNVPFGGTLHLMINHRDAYLAEARYYRVRFIQEDGSIVSVPGGFTDFLWNRSLARWDQAPTTQLTVSGFTGLYPLRVPNDLWYNAYLGAVLNSRHLKNGLVKLEVTFFDGAGKPMSGLSFQRLVLIDNNNASVSLKLPVIGGREQALTCGALQYKAKTDEFLLDYKVAHPNNNAVYSLNIYRGGTWLPPPVSESGKVEDANPPKVTTVQDILGTCNIANVSIAISVGVRVTDGYQWIGGDGRSLSFTLVPDSIPLH